MAANANDPNAQRLFFGLPLPHAACVALQSVGQSLSLPDTARPSLPQNYHVTLVFLGSVSERQLACAQRAADPVQVRSFPLQIDHIGHWPRPQVLWAAPSAPPDGLLQLVATLQRNTMLCGFEPEQREYRPHVTLARRVRGFDGPRKMPGIAWQAQQFHLYRSRPTADGVRYHPIAAWPLVSR